jgi:hypothetical protein
MPDQIENADTTEPTTEPTTDAAQDKKPKVTFTPEQQLHINGLLKREREKETTKWTEVVSAKDTQITDMETGLQAVIDVQTADFNPLVKTLLKDLPVLEQWKKLSDQEFITQARQQNHTPKPPTTKTDEHPVEKEIGFGGRY